MVETNKESIILYFDAMLQIVALFQLELNVVYCVVMNAEALMLPNMSRLIQSDEFLRMSFVGAIEMSLWSIKM